MGGTLRYHPFKMGFSPLGKTILSWVRHLWKTRMLIHNKKCCAAPMRHNAPHEVWTWWGNVTWVSPSGTCGEASNTKMGGTLQSGKPCLRNRQRGEDHSDFTKLRYVHSFNMVETHHFSIVIFGIKTMGILGQVFLRIGIPIPFLF